MTTDEGASATATPHRTGWRPADWAGAAVRALLLAALLTGVASTLAASFPAWQSDGAALTRDLEAGKVKYLDYDQSTVRWSTGWGQWKETSIIAADPRGAQSGGSLDGRVYETVRASGQPVVIRARSNSDWWIEHVPNEPLRVMIVVAWLGTFLMMLSRARHRYANRWAWFWMFTFGQFGPFAYLVLEPHPIWRTAAQTSARDKPPIGGGRGLLLAILVPILASIVASVLLTLH